MKTSLIPTTLLMAVACSPWAFSQDDSSYTNYIWQTQLYKDGSKGITQILPNLDPIGNQDSPLILGGAHNAENDSYEYSGAKFELFTMHASGTEYKLAETYVDSDTAKGKIELFSQDPFTPPRTRTDQGFRAVINLGNLVSPTTQNAAAGRKAVQYRRYIQAYAAKGNGANNDPNQATLLSVHEMTLNDVNSVTRAAEVDYPASLVPGDPIKRRGEERHEIWSVPDEGKPSYKLASSTIQVWPMPTGGLKGLGKDGTLYRYQLPEITLGCDDLYPNSTVMARVYKGTYQSGEPDAEKVFPVAGASLTNNDPTPRDCEFKLPLNWIDDLKDDGEWTIELVARTPFEPDGKRPLLLDHHTFNLDRKMKVNSAISTSE